jgi:hypothetical protein
MRTGLLRASATALVAIVACTSNGAHPPELGNCVPVEGGICTTTVVVGGSSGGEAGTGDGGSCTVSAGSSQCGECATQSCCSELEECAGSTTCSNLLSCEDGCLGGASCLTGCQQQFPTGVSTLQSLSSCLTRDCVVCDESGVGDPCGPQYYACETGLSCGGSWCTRSCVRSSDCVGLGANGANTLGFPNACMATTSGDACTPGCASAADCAAFPGTYCYATTDVGGSNVSVCAPLPDASTKD